MSDPMTIEDLASKIEWEGCIAEAIRYGITASHVPEVVRTEWGKAEVLVAALDEVITELSETLMVDG